MSADTAPAAMPSEEDVARALCIAQGNNPDFDYDPNGVSDAPGTNLCWKLYLGQARAILDLFAPILAEKERQYELASEGRAAFAARALAAEAALAAERERCVNAAFRALDQMRDEGENDIRWAQERVGSAIRAQGE